jgi:hypothetical protein
MMIMIVSALVILVVALGIQRLATAPAMPSADSYIPQSSFKPTPLTKDQPPEEKMMIVGDGRVQVTSPTSGAFVSSPIVVTGNARGSWYFEGSFPVELQDPNGSIIARTTATAESDWMTSDFVPFHATLSFPTSTTGEVVLILRRDNPSGLAENDAEVRRPLNVK